MDRLTCDTHEFFTENALTALNSKQIYNVLDFVKTPIKSLEFATNLPFREILDVRKILLKKYSPKPQNAYTCYQNIPLQSAIIQTGIKSLDTLLEGGLLTGNIYEICGLSASGKTLMCLTLLKNAASKIPDIYYLDTKGDFSGLKLKRMLFSLNKEQLVEALNKILVKKITSRHELFSSLHEIKLKLQNHLKLKLLIIDSLLPLYFQDSDLTETNAFLNHLANTLNYLAKEFNIVIVITNLVTLWNEGDFKNIDALIERVSCGSYWYKVPHVRLRLNREGDGATVRLLKNVKMMPSTSTCRVKFTNEGII